MSSLKTQIVSKKFQKLGANERERFTADVQSLVRQFFPTINDMDWDRLVKSVFVYIYETNRKNAQDQEATMREIIAQIGLKVPMTTAEDLESSVAIFLAVEDLESSVAIFLAVVTIQATQLGILGK